MCLEDSASLTMLSSIFSFFFDVIQRTGNAPDLRAATQDARLVTHPDASQASQGTHPDASQASQGMVVVKI